VQEKILQCWKIVSRPGSADAVLENDFQCRKRFCSAGKSFPGREVPMQCWKMTSSTGKDFPALRSHFLYSIFPVRDSVQIH
jgi:hypothetical protein